jgi:hypothetical protein
LVFRLAISDHPVESLELLVHKRPKRKRAE